MDSSSCKSIKEHCYVCNKPGHFPNSKNCKKRRKSSIRKKDKKQSTYARISKKNLKLIKKRIKEIEMFNLQQEDLVSHSAMFKKKFEVQLIPNSLIPFISMYVFLNYDFVFPKNIVKKRKTHKNFIYFCTKEVQRKKSLEKQIVKAAERCAHYFADGSSSYDKATLLKLSSKTFRKIMKTKTAKVQLTTKQKKWY